MKLLFFGTLLILLLLTGMWYADHPGTVHIAWLGYTIDTNPMVLSLAILILFTFTSFALNMLSWILSIPSLFRRGTLKRNHRLGLMALTQATESLLAGDGKTAMKAAARAESLLPDSPLPLFYMAKAAHLKGDTVKAKDYLTRLSQHKESSLMGIRGLMFYAHQDQHSQALVELAEKAFATRQDIPWVLSILFDQAIKSKNWDKALDLWHQERKSKLLSVEQLTRKKAMILLAESEDLLGKNKIEEAVGQAKKAYKMDNTNVIPALIYARLLVQQGEDRKARGVIQEAWKIQPHPDLAQLYVSSLGNKTSAERIALIKELCAKQPTHVESQLLLAESYMKESLWGDARAGLEPLIRTHPSKRLYHVMAHLDEQQYGNAERAHVWLKHAADAPAEPSWTCTSCSHKSPEVHAICPTCHSFDTLSWGTQSWQVVKPTDLLSIDFVE